MSRAGTTKKLQVDAGFTEQIPLKPDVVVAYEEGLRERKRLMLYGRCRVIALGRGMVQPEILGAVIADNVLNRIMQQMTARQSQIVLPERIGA